MIEDANHKIGMLCSRYGCSTVSVVDTEMGAMCSTHASPLLFSIQTKTGRGLWESDRFFLPWEMVKPHERQAQRNHGQTLARLSERGGLSPSEALAVLEGQDGWGSYRFVDYHVVKQKLQERLQAFKAGVTTP